MKNPHNPFDETIWEPGGEHAIEDPFHGPSAIQSMLQTPAMPLGDGRYYQPGAYYTFGTPYVDPQGQPVPEITLGSSMADSMREGHELREWLAAYHDGDEEALIELEATRQQQRLDETGFVFSFKPSDVCGGGKRIDACPAGSAAFGAAEEWKSANAQERPGEGTIWMTLAWLGGTCADCTLSCEVAIKTVDGQPKETRFTNSRRDPDIPAIELEPYEPRLLTAEELEQRERLLRLEEDQNSAAGSK